jgi:hypothetical protein
MTWFHLISLSLWTHLSLPFIKKQRSDKHNPFHAQWNDGCHVQDTDHVTHIMWLSSVLIWNTTAMTDQSFVIEIRATPLRDAMFNQTCLPPDMTAHLEYDKSYRTANMNNTIVFHYSIKGSDPPSYVWPVDRHTYPDYSGLRVHTISCWVCLTKSCLLHRADLLSRYFIKSLAVLIHRAHPVSSPLRPFPPFLTVNFD